jgi:hypothetical protein
MKRLAIASPTNVGRAAVRSVIRACASQCAGMMIVLVCTTACKKHDRYERLDHEASKGVFVEVPLDAPPGLSGLALDDNDALWAIPERDHQLVEIRLDGDFATTKLYPISGIPPGVDTEGLAYLGDNKFAIAFEGQDEAIAGVFFAERKGDRIVVTRTRQLTSPELGVALTSNHGAEGACGRGSDVLIGIEATGKLPDGKRYAPIAWLHGDVLTVTKLKLTSDVGKVSSLDCTIARDGTANVWAIERHYGVSRILKFDMKPGDREVAPKITLDLGPILNDSLNLEGIVQLRDGRLVAVVDNQSATIEGPNELLVFAPGVGTK